MNDEMTIHYSPDTSKSVVDPDPHHDVYHKTVFGFWTYLMTDCMIFMSLFVTYLVLSPQTFGGPKPQDLFELPLAYAETFALLVSSLTCGFALLAAQKRHLPMTLWWLGVTFFLGTVFLTLEISEFIHFISIGASWRESAFLSAFFTLVGTHGLHITAGLIWILVMGWQVSTQGLTVNTFRRLVLLNMFWHFLELIWLFVFTLVYLKGVIGL